MEPTRRALLKGAPVAVAAIAAPVSAFGAASLDRTSWERALATYDQIIAEDAAFSHGYLRTWEACNEECEKVPHIVLEPSAYDHKPHVSTADAWYVRRCRSDVVALDEGRMRFDPLPELQVHERQMRALVDAADARDRAIQAIRDRYDMDALDARSEAFGDAIAEAQNVLMDMASPDLAALRWKLTRLRDGEGTMAAWTAEYVAQTYADIARLMPAAA